MKARLCSTKFDGLILLAVRLERQAIYTRLQITMNLEATQTPTYLLSEMKRKISEEHDLNKKLSRPRFSQHNYRKIHRREKKDVCLYLK